MHFSRLDPSAATAPPNPEYFDGTVRMQKVLTPDQSRELERIAVHFESGARAIPPRIPGNSACHVSIRRPGPSDWNVARRDW
jgi:hypothetical protein